MWGAAGRSTASNRIYMRKEKGNLGKQQHRSGAMKAEMAERERDKGY